MKNVYEFAFRNLIEHKSKSIIISSLLIVGVAVSILGNSFLVSINKGLKKDFRENYTGDIVISAKPGTGERIDIFGVISTDVTQQSRQIPPINEIEKVEEIIKASKHIKGYTKQISTRCFVLKDEEVDLSFMEDFDGTDYKAIPLTMLFAQEGATFHKLFDSIDYIEGTFPKENTNEVLIEYREKSAYEKLYKEELKVGDKVLVTGMSTDATIREAVVCGFFRPKNINTTMLRIMYCSPYFARSFAELTYANSFTQELPENVLMNLSSISEEDLFLDFDIDYVDSDLKSNLINYDEILGDTKLRDHLSAGDDGAWQFLIIKVKNQNKTEKVIEELREQCNINDLKVQVLDWKDGAYSYTGTIKEIIILFNILIGILAVVIFIIIANTISISVSERVNEIGTIRAIGAGRKFIFMQFTMESLFISLSSTVIGYVLSLITTGIINGCRIPVESSIAKTILGGSYVHFMPSVSVIILTFIIAIGGCILSNVGPVLSALKITPLKALNNE